MLLRYQSGSNVAALENVYNVALGPAVCNMTPIKTKNVMHDITCDAGVLCYRAAFETETTYRHTKNSRRSSKISASQISETIKRMQLLLTLIDSSSELPIVKFHQFCAVRQRFSDTLAILAVLFGTKAAS